MIALLPNLAVGFSRTRKLLFIALILCLVLLPVLAACSPSETAAVESGQDTMDAVVLSAADLEAQYGLRVTLLAVTAAGGLVDVRFKFVNGEKAKTLLQEPANFPTLLIADSQVTLSAPEEGRPAELQFDDNANLFLLYPNAGGVVKPSTPVTVVFGDLHLEPINAK